MATCTPALGGGTPTHFQSLILDLCAEHERLQKQNAELRAQVNSLSGDGPTSASPADPQLAVLVPGQVVHGALADVRVEDTPPGCSTSAAPSTVVPTDSHQALPEWRPSNQRPSGLVGQFVEEAEKVQPQQVSEKQALNFKNVVTSSSFELAFSVLIIVNCIVMAFEVQYRGIDNGYDIGYPDTYQRASDSIPWGAWVLHVLEMVFGCLFTLEVLAKVVGLKNEFHKSAWNLFDALIVVVWLIDKCTAASSPLNPMSLRLARVFRIARLVKKAKSIKALDSLHVLIGSITASFAVLAWSTVIILFCQMTVALFVANALEDYIKSDQHDIQHREEVYRYFGTFTRSMLSMFELTLANWIPVTRTLVDNVGEWWAICMVTYKMVIGFAVIKVISGVFMHETFNVASSDAELMVVQKNRRTKAETRRMDRFFREADESGDGYISKTEFQAVLEKPGVRTWLSAMELEVGDYEVLFNFIDNGDGKISAQELINGVTRLKGAARSIDMATLMQRVDGIEDRLDHQLGMTNRLTQQTTEALRSRNRG